MSSIWWNFVTGCKQWRQFQLYQLQFNEFAKSCGFWYSMHKNVYYSTCRYQKHLDSRIQKCWKGARKNDRTKLARVSPNAEHTQPFLKRYLGSSDRLILVVLFEIYTPYSYSGCIDTTRRFDQIMFQNIKFSPGYPSIMILYSLVVIDDLSNITKYSTLSFGTLQMHQSRRWCKTSYTNKLS